MFLGKMHAALKNFRNARWFYRHPYAYKKLWIRRRKIARGEPVLWNAELCFDVACNYKCLHCSIATLQSPAMRRHEMTLAEVERTADELASMDCFLCCIVGGEPTMRRDLPDIIFAFHKRQILPTLITNGYRITDEYLRSLIDAGLFSIGFSLSGLSPDSHDSFVCEKGAFAQQMRAIEIAHRSKVNVSLAVVPTHQTVVNGEYARLIAFATARGIRVNVNYPALAGQFAGHYEQLLSKAELIEVRKFFTQLNVTSDFTVLGEKDGGVEYECPAGRKKIYILPDGSVCPCTFIHISFGNILKESLVEIMKRIWATKIFMSRPKLCLTGESESFNRRFLEPVFSANPQPLYYTEHPLFKAGKF